jgi:apolipoprotein N-acyltransferase
LGQLSAFLQSWWLRSRYPHAAATGILLALAFPNCGIAGLAWVAPALMLAVAAGTDGRHCFHLGYVAGLAYHLTSLYWLLLIPVTFFPILGWLALSAYLAFYPAAWVWFAWRAWPAPARTAGDPDCIAGLPWQGWIRRTGWALLVASTWVGLEMIRARFLGGFPWNPLGATQFEMTPLLQISSITGVYGVSFLVAWFAAGLLCTGLGLLRAPTRRAAWLADLALPLLALAATFAWGLHVMRRSPPPARTLNVALVQPSIPQTEIWDPAENEARFAEVIRLSEEALSTSPDLLLWPEAAVPELMRWDVPTYQAITNLAGSHRVWMIIGADDAIPSDTSEEAVIYYNSSWLIGPAGEIHATYRKQQLVAFGEEVPFNRWLPFLNWFTPITGSFTRGSGFVPFALDSLEIETTTLICFEDVFPHLARHAVTSETDFMVNLTNDGWFRQGASQRQQAASSVFRAVENGRPLVRCTNNGQTCWVDRFGRIVETFLDEDGTIYGAGWTVFTVGLADPGQPEVTFYRQRGDLFGWFCAGVSSTWLLLRLVNSRRNPPSRPTQTPRAKQVTE